MEEPNNKIIECQEIPIRRGDLEDLAEKVCLEIDRFVNNCVISPEGVFRRDDIRIIRRFVDEYFTEWCQLSYQSVTVHTNASWITSENCMGGSSFNLDIHLSEKDVSYTETIMTFHVTLNSNHRGIETCKTELQYLYYE